MDASEAIKGALEVSKGIGDYGMMAVTAAFFLIIAVTVIWFFIKWVQKMMDNLITSNNTTMAQLLEETRKQNERLNDISEGLRPETQIRIKTISNMAFDLEIEKVCRLIKKVREENHISDREATEKKIRLLISNIHKDRNSKFDNFHYRGVKLSAYTNQEWIEQVSKVVENEIYNEEGENNKRAFTNVEATYASIRLDLYQNLDN